MKSNAEEVSDSLEYLIDGRNRRIGKKVNGVLQKGWLYKDQLNPVAELDADGNVVAQFVYGACPNCPSYMVKCGQTYAMLSDHLGSPRLVVNQATGAIAQALEYDSFGVQLSNTASEYQPFGFAGGLYDGDTGLVRFGVRDYDALVGRWTAKDPIRFAGNSLNLYTYSVNNPMSFLDVDGRIFLGDGPLIDMVMDLALDPSIPECARSAIQRMQNDQSFTIWLIDAGEIQGYDPGAEYVGDFSQEGSMYNPNFDPSTGGDIVLAENTLSAFSSQMFGTGVSPLRNALLHELGHAWDAFSLISSYEDTPSEFTCEPQLSCAF